MNTPVEPQSNKPHRLPPIAIILGALFFLGLMGLMLYGVSRSDRPDRDSLPSALIGKPAPAFSLPVLHDPSVHVTGKQLRGAPYVLNVWGSWCPTCRDEHPILTRFAETKRVRMIGYNWKDEPSEALRWLEQLGNPYMIVLADQEGRTALDWGIAAAPETFLVDGAGIVRWKYSGAITQQVMDEQLIPALEKVEAANGGHKGAPDLGTLR
ncbi:DsbE family thiol:disulfide interchange protein [Stenotrophomonas sp.]|uniref:DsbE family thiol:disulfide interchange protein n=1 Tax=Stenotrophomonas sp. TaxID=69392 RepID=UPI0028AB6A4A|nr:DsbE family thiol:disulfide interchange protein [Stenotrophomonas sp.]